MDKKHLPSIQLWWVWRQRSIISVSHLSEKKHQLKLSIIGIWLKHWKLTQNPKMWNKKYNKKKNKDKAKRGPPHIPWDRTLDNRQDWKIILYFCSSSKKHSIYLIINYIKSRKTHLFFKNQSSGYCPYICTPSHALVH